MQRKQLEIFYNVKIFYEYADKELHYTLLLPEGTKTFKHIGDIEDYLKERARNGKQ